MKLRRSKLHGYLEEEVNDFVSCLEHEHDLSVKRVVVIYTDNDVLEEEEIMHTFLCSDGSSNCDEL